VRKLFNDEQRTKLGGSGGPFGGVHGKVLPRAFQYWKNINAKMGERIEKKMRERSASNPPEEIRKR
jgi:catalase